MATIQEINNKFNQFAWENGVSPNSVNCEIMWKDNQRRETTYIALIPTIGLPMDDEVLFSCEKGLGEFCRLLDPNNGEDFVVVDVNFFDTL